MLQTVPPPSRGPQTSTATLAERPPAETANEEEVFEPQRVITARLDRKMHREIRLLAGKCGVSMNQFVVAAIEHALRNAQPLPVHFPDEDLRGFGLVVGQGTALYTEEGHGKPLEYGPGVHGKDGVCFCDGCGEASRDRSGEADAAAPYKGAAAAVA